MVTAGPHLEALGNFLEGLAALSEHTGVGIHADGPVALDVEGQRFAFEANCQDGGGFTYGLMLAPREDS